MNTESVYKHAIVIGGSMAGMTAARMLARSLCPGDCRRAGRRPGPGEFPQRSAPDPSPHALLGEGQRLLEKMSGVVQITQSGTIRANIGNEFGFYINNSWCQPYESPIVTTVLAAPCWTAPSTAA